MRRNAFAEAHHQALPTRGFAWRNPPRAVQQVVAVGILACLHRLNEVGSDDLVDPSSLTGCRWEPRLWAAPVRE